MSLLIDGHTLIKYTDEAGIFSVTLPEDITNVERKAFDGCNCLRCVTGINVRSIGRIWGNHEIKGARRDLCLVFPSMDIAREPAYTFKMALCLGFLRDPALYAETLKCYEKYALIQKNWLLRSLIGTNSDELLYKALDFYREKNVLTRAELEEIYLPCAIETGCTLSSAVIMSLLNDMSVGTAANALDEFEL